MAATLTDVSRKARVSLATASRAFNDPDRLALETRKKVLAAAAELGYEALIANGIRTFTVIVPDIANPVFASLVRSIQSQAWQGRHRMLLSDSAENTLREQEILRTIGTGTDGVVLCSPRSDAASIREAIGDTPLVVINGDVDFAVCVQMDVTEGIRQAVEHLHALGHRQLAFVPGPATSWANVQRLNAVSESASEWGMELKLVGNQSASVDGGLAAAASVVSTGATAVIAYNDLVAMGVQAGARALGRDCPKDLSIVGIDGLDIAAVSEPGLTTIRVATTRSGAMALEFLLNLISGHPGPGETVRLDSQLIVRGSTGRAANSPERVNH